MRFRRITGTIERRILINYVPTAERLKVDLLSHDGSVTVGVDATVADRWEDSWLAKDIIGPT